MFIRLPIRLIFLSNSIRHPQDKKSTVIIFKFAVIRLKKIHENGDQKFTVKYLKIDGIRAIHYNGRHLKGNFQT